MQPPSGETPPPMQPMSSPPDAVAYPRAGTGGLGGGYRRPPGAYFDFIGIAWEVIRANLGTWMACSLVYLIISYAVNIPFAFITVPLSQSLQRNVTSAGFALYILLSLGSGIISYAVSWPMFVGMGLMGRRAAYGLPINFSDAFFPYRRFLSVAVSAIIAYVVVIAGFVLCILPGMAAGGLFALTPFYAAEGESVGDSLGHSARDCRPFFIPLIFLYFVASLVSGLGAILCIVGVLVTLPILAIVLGLTYDTIRPLQLPPVPVSPYGYGAPQS